jgi:hypothetical protein
MLLYTASSSRSNALYLLSVGAQLLQKKTKWLPAALAFPLLQNRAHMGAGRIRN